MPSIKTNRSRLTKEKRNKRVRTYARSRVAAARSQIENEPEAPETLEAINVALKTLDQTAAKGVIHKNNAARRKSRLVAQFNKANNT